MRLAQTLNSASFKLTAAYAILFTLSVGILAALIYLLVTSEMERGMRARVVADSDALKAEYSIGGTRQLLLAIAERQRGHVVGGLDYTLIDAKGRHLFGTLPSVPCQSRWTIFTGPPDGDEAPGQMEELGAYITPLSHGYCLLVADDLGKVGKLGSLILKSFGWVLLLSLTMAVGGGIFLSSRFLKRIEAINRTAEAIIEGDITRRIPRRDAADDLDRLAATLNRMLDRTTNLMESLRHVSNDVAHDLRTPLGRLRRHLDEAQSGAHTPEQYRAAIEQAAMEVDGILDTFGAILRIAQIESGSRRAGFQRLLLSDLAADVCETFAPSFEDAGKTLRTDIEPGLWVQGDRELLVQSLANLLENAIAHTPSNTTTTVSLKTSGDVIELDVADNGSGVPEADRNRIFERFCRLEPSRTASGNGLGLSIVAAVAELHAGKISAADNAPGLRIGLRLPAAA
ncbi:MAG: HAMP domain-containing histidine kinase [Alphaproteobacteria bacterium]|nr:HAMP domain-containing histidine kinase [Alphaproteobacteria bacterium]